MATQARPYSRPSAPANATTEPNPKQLADRIMGTAWRAMKNPAWGKKNGIVPEQPGLFDDAAARGYERWLRGAIAALMPRGWTWRIDRGSGGYVALVITGREARGNA